MKRALAMVALALVFVPSAAAVEATIYPGVGIGKVKLGMTNAQVEKILGGDALADDRSTIAGHAYLQLGWNFGSRSVGFLLQNGRYHAVRIGTTEPNQHTVGRVGPRTHWLKVVRAYPGGICSWLFAPPNVVRPPQLEYLVSQKGGTQLLFTFQVWPNPRSFDDYVTFAVQEVVVRDRYQALPEFAPGYQHRCAAGWQSTPKPRIR
jgi:hypothetical protein